ncbi:uncharacterized protein ANIA_11558 [Aspergillus nidulans FGSC A4]|uniref:Uncharacterized protein n=1 Tax=Emericella nidulans (strain FGSC A4 / ATCC 38163 / CBS 112.46 / NRRL 194 / M139) TaxID=227321 RepID=C8VCD3_EMENI|nr:hypothetical protein [Aspergillus nidulans FGSC A4]CBF78435.1 TPA: hypothetical protein ANIA_11558 [Aspergillus nidulans FGSC A4]
MLCPTPTPFYVLLVFAVSSSNAEEALGSGSVRAEPTIGL